MSDDKLVVYVSAAPSISATSVTTINTNTSSTHPTTRDLPTQYLEQIGRIIVDFAFIEWRLRMAYFALVVNDPAIGRLAIGDPRVEQTIQRICQVANARKLVLKTDLASLGDSLSACEKQRDLLGHGVWLKLTDTGQLCIQNINGKWDRQSREPKRLRREYPEAVAIDDRWFSETNSALKTALEGVNRLHDEVSALPAP